MKWSWHRIFTVSIILVSVYGAFVIIFSHRDPTNIKQYLGYNNEPIIPIHHASAKVISVPRLHIGACLPPSPFAEVVKNLFCYVSKPTTSGYRERTAPAQRSMSGECAHVSRSQSDYEEANKVALVQDPMSRFLDTFIEKCAYGRHTHADDEFVPESKIRSARVRRSDDENYRYRQRAQQPVAPTEEEENLVYKKPKSTSCFGCQNDLKCVLESLYARLQEITQSPSDSIPDYEAGPHDDDILIYPLSWYCNFKRSLHDTTMIKLDDDSDNLASDELDDFFSANGVKSSQMAEILKSIDDMLARQSTYHSEMRQSLRAELEQDPYLMSLFSKIFYNDYKLFGFRFIVKKSNHRTFTT